jgi:hypothetical protein
LKNNKYFLFFVRKRAFFMAQPSVHWTYKLLKGITPVVFIGLCIKTGSLLFSVFVSLFINPEASRNLYLGLNLSDLMDFDHVHYVITVVMLLFLSGLKAWMALDLVRIMSDLNMEQPFSERVYRFIIRIARTAGIAGVLALLAQKHAEWLIRQGVSMPIEWAAPEILLFAAVLMVIAQVFRRGIDLQQEQTLTV